MQPVELDSTLTALTVNRSDFPKFGEMLRAIRIWSTVPADCQSPAPSIRRKPVKLTADQIRQFDEQGYCFFPNCFAEEEIALMRSGADEILNQQRPEVWREKSGAPRTAFAAHQYNEVFRLLAHHPRLVEPLQQVFGESVYVPQFKLNAKAAFEGDVWQWHQDYGTWARDDGMPDARAMNIAVFLAEAGGADLIIIYNSGRYRMAGRGSLAGLMPYGDANAIVMEMAHEVLPVVRNTPVLAGVCGTDPFRVMDRFLRDLKQLGFSGVQNFPTVGLIDGQFRESLEETGMSFDVEVDMIARAHELDLLTCPYVFNPDEARAMAKAGADLLIA